MDRRLFCRHRPAVIGATLLTAALVAATPVQASVRADIRSGEDHSGQLENAERCSSHIAAYRGAIGYLDGHLDKSPVKLTYITRSGEEVVVLNRHRARLQQDRRILAAGLQARTRACSGALSG